MPITFDASYPELTVSLIFPAPIGTVDVTQQVNSIRTTRGRSRETDRYTGTAQLTLANDTGQFTPGNLAGPYVSGGVSFVRPRVQIQIQARWDDVTYGLFYGFVSSWQDTFGGEGLDPITTIACVDALSLIAAWKGQPLAVPVGASERTGARFSRILTAAGWTLPSTVDAGTSTLQATDLAGNGLDQLATVAEAEGGLFWCEGDGRIVFEDRGATVTNSRSNTSQVTFSDAAGMTFREASTSQADDLIFNTATFQTVGGAPVTVSDATSITLFGERSYPSRGALPNENATDVTALAEYAVARYKDPAYRVVQLTIDPVRNGTTQWFHALARRLRDRAIVTIAPVRPAITITRDVFIEGVSHVISQNSWATTFQFSDATFFNGLASSRWDVGLWDTLRWYW